LADSCPLVAENYNNYLDTDGCPDSVPTQSGIISAFIDTDKDGYYDSLDSCPTEPETWNRYQDEDGCP